MPPVPCVKGIKVTKERDFFGNWGVGPGNNGIQPRE